MRPHLTYHLTFNPTSLNIFHKSFFLYVILVNYLIIVCDIYYEENSFYIT